MCLRPASAASSSDGPLIFLKNVRYAPSNQTTLQTYRSSVLSSSWCKERFSCVGLFPGHWAFCVFRVRLLRSPTMIVLRHSRKTHLRFCPPQLHPSPKFHSRDSVTSLLKPLRLRFPRA